MSERKPFNNFGALGRKNFNDDYYVDENVYYDLVAIRAYLIRNHPFWGYLSMDLPLVESDPRMCQTASTDGFHIYYNRDFVASLNAKKNLFLLLHELYHNHYDHMGEMGELRYNFKDHPKAALVANAAQDTFINLEILENGIGELPTEGAYKDPKYKGWATEEIIVDMLENDDLPSGQSFDIHIEYVHDDGDDGQGGQQSDGQDGQDGQQSGSGDGKTEQYDNGRVTVHRDANGNIERITIKVSKAEREQQKQQWADKVVRIGMAAIAQEDSSDSSASSVPANVRRMIENLKAPTVDWRPQLAHFVQSTIKRGYAYTRPNKKVQDRRIVLPHYRKRDKKLSVAVAIDTSGSIGSDFLVDFFSELSGMLKAFTQYEAHVFCFDADVDEQSYVKMRGNVHNINYNVEDYIKENIHGGGGTIYESVWQFMESQKINPRGLVMLTDGYPFGDGYVSYRDYCPTLFVVKGNPGWRAPFGKTIHLAR